VRIAAKPTATITTFSAEARRRFGCAYASWQKGGVALRSRGWTGDAPCSQETPGSSGKVPPVVAAMAVLAALRDRQRGNGRQQKQSRRQGCLDRPLQQSRKVIGRVSGEGGVVYGRAKGLTSRHRSRLLWRTKGVVVLGAQFIEQPLGNSIDRRHCPGVCLRSIAPIL
jgi:hypothetical protein